MIAYASSHIEAAQSIVTRIENAILFPVMTFMLTLAILYFFWGAYEFVLNAENDAGRETGKRHMMYAIIGMLVMISALAILKIAAGTFGCDINVPGSCGRI